VYVTNIYPKNTIKQAMSASFLLLHKTKNHQKNCKGSIICKNSLPLQKKIDV